ncbi:SAM-dependent methyltransferase [Tenacibaculum litopenaei]|uniref:class I SAM-dependent methyltransferase n=1 Tax=Tenacibaculum litopenaei TaxID=396016 RepID=UPI0038934BF5
MKEELTPLISAFEQRVSDDSFVKLTLSKPIRKSEKLQNVYIRQVLIKDELNYQFLYRYTTNDQVKNYSFEEGVSLLVTLLAENFRAATLFSLENDFLTFVSKKKKVSFKTTAASFKNKPPQSHDKPKLKRAEDSLYLKELGVLDNEGNLIPKMSDKYRQINKYLEVIEAQLKSVKLPKQIHIVDMGSGKGYLTFALYDYLVNKKGFEVSMTGIELRTELVNYCNDLAEKCNFTKLDFAAKPIEEYNENQIDILIALHACDTATDDAIYKGLVANASLIICAPCCHKQVRQQVKGKEQESPILKYGIFKERQFEMVTDTLRALIMEKHNYQTKVFEFISNEHTRKNVMLVGAKTSKKVDADFYDSKIAALKESFCIEQHYLEGLLWHE